MIGARYTSHTPSFHKQNFLKDVLVCWGHQPLHSDRWRDSVISARAGIKSEEVVVD